MKDRREEIRYARSVGIAFISFGMLLFEIVLTRIFSVVLTYHFTFLVISLALLGVGIGGIAEYLLSRRNVAAGKPDFPEAVWAAAAAAVMVASPFIIGWISRAESLSLLILMALMPFSFASSALASVFRRHAQYSSRFYASDLLGAAAGSLAAVWALNATGGENSLIIAGLITSAGAAFLSFGQISSRWAAALVATAVAGVAMVFYNGQGSSNSDHIRILRNPNKDLYRILSTSSSQARIMDTRWSAFGRTDLVEFGADSTLRELFIDGAAGTAMYRWNGRLDPTSSLATGLTRQFTGMFPLAFLDNRQRDNALIIGPGGGRDVLANLIAGVREITAVEVNPDFVKMMNKYRKYNGGLYTDLPNVRVVVDDGRHFLKTTHKRYDIIMLTVPVTKSSRGFAAYALTENFLFTKEAFRDYLEHLTPEGSLIFIGHGPFESVKFLTTALAAFGDLGTPVTEAMRRIYLLDSKMMPVFVAQRTPLDSTRAAKLHTALHLAGFNGAGSYVPYAKQMLLLTRVGDRIEEWQVMNDAMIALAKGDLKSESLIEAAPVNIAPATDDSPFFFKFEYGVPGAVNALLWISGLFLALMISVPKLINTRHDDNVAAMRWSLPLFFGSIGAGFMVVEVALFQKFVLYLGNPVVTLALLLFSLLVGAGIGGRLSGMFSSRFLERAMRIAAIAVAAFVLLIDAVLTPLFEYVAPLGIATPSVAVILLILLGIPMGVPFPLGLRLLAEAGHKEDIPWIWGVNGAASVFGSAIAIGTAVLFGYSAALAVGGIAYLSAGLATVGFRAPTRLLANCSPQSAPSGGERLLNSPDSLSGDQPVVSGVPPNAKR